jgi:ribose transport system ATP-binding protein
MDFVADKQKARRDPTSEGALLRGFLDLSKTFASKAPIEERLKEIAAKIAKLLDLKGCLIRLLDERGHLQIAASFGLNSRYLDKGYPNEDQCILQAIEGCQPVVVPDTDKDNRLQYPREIAEEGIRAIVTFPICARGDVIGVLRIFDAEPREFSYEEIQLISTIADRTGIAYCNARDQEHHRRQIEYMVELQSVGKIISSTLSLDEVLKRVAEAVVKVLNLKGCLIRLYNPKTRILELKMSIGLSDKYLNKGPINAQTSLVEAMKGEVVVIYDARNDERVQYRNAAAEEGIGSMISAPMLLKGEVIGVIRLFTTSPKEFSDEELTFITVLADHCAVAIENARYYENLKFEYQSVLRDSHRKTVLEVRDLCKSFPGVEALKNVSFVLKEGEIHGLLGENGAGKSTLIKILTGVYSMTSGRVLLDGEEVRIKDTKTARSLGFSTVYQDTNLIESMSIGENIMMGALPTYGPFRFLDRQKVRETVEFLLEQVNLEVDPFTPVAELTTGQKQMVMLAKVLYGHKKFVILDEPTTALSGVEIETYFDVLRKLKDQGLSVIYISHVLDEVFEICDRITIIRDGLNVATKRIDELDKVEVSRLMVGREIKARFDTRTELTAQPVLQCRYLASEKLKEPINLEVRGGEIVGVVGARGSGEEELVRLILGLGKQTQGEVLINSRGINGSALSERINGGIGFIPPDRLNEGIFPNIPCLYNLGLPVLDRHSRYGWMNHDTLLKEASRAIKTFDIKVVDPFQEVKYLSGGNQQKILISKWVNARSKVYLMCDPTAGVDVGAKDEIYELVIKLAREGSGILFVSHDLEEIFKVCHRIVVFHKGKIVFEAPIDITDRGEILYYLMGGGSKCVAVDGNPVEKQQLG